MVKAVFDNFAVFRRLHPALSTLEIRELVPSASVMPIHPGALRVRSRVGAWPQKIGLFRKHQLAPRRFSQAVPPPLLSHGGRWAACLASAGLLRASAQAHSAAAPGTGCAFVDKLNPSSLKRSHDLRQTFYHAADGAVAGFHALNGRKRYARCLRERFLFHTHKGSSRLQLGCGEQCRSPTQILNIMLDLWLMFQPSKLESLAYSLARSPPSKSLNTAGSDEHEQLAHQIGSFPGVRCSRRASRPAWVA